MCVSCVMSGVCLYLSYVESVCIQCGEWYTLASSPGSFPLSARGRKEPGNTGGFKPLTSGGSDRSPPIRLQNKVMWMCNILKAWQTKGTQPKITKSYDC